jgi:hypothetical protein
VAAVCANALALAAMLMVESSFFFRLAGAAPVHGGNPLSWRTSMFLPHLIHANLARQASLAQLCYLLRPA